ncbi:MAG: L,D-transpeptidase, partial [Chloroflexi bacterium]
PTATNTPTPTATPIPTFVSPLNQKPTTRPLGVGPNERWVDVDLSSQTLTAYEGNNAVMTTLISSGTWDHPTVTGQFRIWLRYESQTMDGRLLGYDYYLPNVPYVMYFYQDYALHGTYWHNNFGTPMSHGCVNMRTEDARWLFYWTDLGTVVNVHQ